MANFHGNVDGNIDFSRLGVDRVLTSGREASAWDGRAVISRLVEVSNGRIVILPGATACRVFVVSYSCQSF